MLGPLFREPWTFADIKDILIVIYLDNLTVFSKKAADHSGHLRQVFDLKGAGSLAYPSTPRSHFFGMVEGKLLGHIVYS